MAETIKVEGLRELQRALRKYDRDLAKELTRRLKEVADIVREQATTLFSHVSPASAAGFRPRARAGIAAVEQSRKRTTGTRPDFGSLQMRMALLPALAAKEPEAMAKLEQMLDELGSEAGF